jgi:NTP pyrophosphatase (non-canonical NTP hydrolase)
MSDADQLRDANPWHPITDLVDLKHLGKLGEECNELGSAISRCIIQGVDEREPVTGKLNREWLQDEIADVLANIDLVIQRFDLDAMKMATRSEKKKRHLRQWHALA